MIYDEYVTKMNSVLSNPDTALAEMAPIYDALKADLSQIDTLTSEKTALEEKVRNLQDTNMRLFLAQTGQPAKEEAGADLEDLTPEGVVNSFIEEIFSE